MQKLNLQFFSQNIFKELVKELTDYRRNSVKFFVCMITISLYKWGVKLTVKWTKF